MKYIYIFLSFLLLPGCRSEHEYEEEVNVEGIVSFLNVFAIEYARMLEGIDEFDRAQIEGNTIILANYDRILDVIDDTMALDVSDIPPKMRVAYMEYNSQTLRLQYSYEKLRPFVAGLTRILEFSNEVRGELSASEKAERQKVIEQLDEQLESALKLYAKAVAVPYDQVEQDIDVINRELLKVMDEKFKAMFQLAREFGVSASDINRILIQVD